MKPNPPPASDPAAAPSADTTETTPSAAPADPRAPNSAAGNSPGNPQPASATPPETKPEGRPLPLWRMALVGVMAGLLAAGALMLIRTEQPVDLSGETQETLTMPEGELRTDAFSLRLLQLATEEEGGGNVAVAPTAVTELILALQALDGHEAEESAARLHLSRTQLAVATLPAFNLQLFADAAQGFDPVETLVMSLPLSSDTQRCLGLINRVSAADATAALVLTDAQLSPDMQMLAVADMRWTPAWLHPVSEVEMLPFRSEGGRPKVPMMKSAASYRIAEAEDGSWRAVALFMRRDAELDSTCFVAVEPKGTLPNFVKGMTPEKLSSIREALLKAPEQTVNLQLPELHLSSGGARDMLPLLRRMDIDPMPLSRSGENKGQAMRGALYVRFLLDIQKSAETAGAPSEQAGAPLFSLDSPFLWWIGDATSDAPFLFMGTVAAP